ncbi:hypothetical protein [Pararhizobium mangrovi]|uniref:Uncharacterized protein n=1 Tax=Pararhizobium mangrovi TaxID=2590452 RepID=A0A506U1X2_9HYPH|nr:hypothetical protein [Pararhizobium mangrovi]TPW25857.1 hypothetical protein FJU11_17520 [Pararhizobium mangrovi]
MDNDEKIRRAQNAEALKNNPAFDEAVERVRGDLLRDFEKSRLVDADQRERIHLSLDLLRKLERAVTAAMEDGKSYKRYRKSLEKPGWRD